MPDWIKPGVPRAYARFMGHSQQIFPAFAQELVKQLRLQFRLGGVPAMFAELMKSPTSISEFRDEEDLAYGFASFHTPMCFGRLGQRQPEADVEAQLAAGDPRQHLLDANSRHFQHPRGSEQPERAYL